MMPIRICLKSLRNECFKTSCEHSYPHPQSVPCAIIVPDCLHHDKYVRCVNPDDYPDLYAQFRNTHFRHTGL